MPKVGNKSFPYDKAGKAKAKKFAKKKGKKVTMSKRGKTALQDMFDMEQSKKKPADKKKGKK